MENTKEIRIAPINKAYVRNNDYANMNWRLINADMGVDTNNAEPVEVKCTTPDEYDRQVYLTFDLSEFADFDFKYVFFLPAICDYKRADGTLDVYALDPNAWNGETVTWETRPAWGERLAAGVKAGGLTRIDLTDAVKALVAKGEKTLSFAIVASNPGPDSYCRFNRATRKFIIISA